MPDTERLQVLPALIPPPPAEEQVGEGSADHPMRRVTRAVAFDPAAWTPERAAKVAALFDDLAPAWSERFRPGRLDPLTDALDRGMVTGRSCLELGSGTGLASPVLAARFPVTVALDLSSEMLRHAPPLPPRALADASCLPVADGAVDVIVAVNMLLFPTEVSRVLSPGGALVWVNSLGDRTPIHLTAAEVLDALGPQWAGVASAAGQGTWCVARRADLGVS